MGDQLSYCGLVHLHFAPHLCWSMHKANINSLSCPAVSSVDNESTYESTYV